jgi:hypothetical protein
LDGVEVGLGDHRREVPGHRVAGWYLLAVLEPVGLVLAQDRPAGQQLPD